VRHWECSWCGQWLQTEMIEVTALGQPRQFIDGPVEPCRRCWWNKEPRVTWWEPVVYTMPIRVVMPSMVVARLIHEGEEIELMPLPVVSVWAGPPADQPMPPTPAQILRAAGIEPPATWLDDPE